MVVPDLDDEEVVVPELEGGDELVEEDLFL